MRFFMLLGLATVVACGSGDRKAENSAVLNASGMGGSGISEQTASPSPSPATPPQPIDVTMPDFAPRYPGSIIRSANSGSTGGADNHEVWLTSRDGADKILEYYRARFAAAGLKKTSEFLSGGTGMMSAMGKGRIASVAIAKEQDRNMIIVTYSGE